MRKLALILLVILTLGTVVLEAQTTGRLTVRVRDNSGKALEFVNIVVLRGTQRITGGQTNERGTAIIINIPPGTYSVKFSLVGYDETTYQDVKIQVDAATNLAPSLKKGGITLHTTVVTAETEKVDKAQVGSKRTIDVEKMSDVAVSDVAGIISLQAGVTSIGGELHIRGGRANEVNYTIDGMSVSDPVDGGSALQVDTDAISDMNVMTGGFSAEFGNAQSGVVNIVTRDGDPDYSGRVEYQTDHLIGEGRNSDVVKFSFGGPMLGYAFGDLRERFTFFINGGGEWLDGRLKDYYIGDPNKDFLLNGVQLLEYEYPGYDPYASRDNIAGVDTGNRNYNSYNVNFKSKYVISPQQRLTFAVRGDRSFNLPFSYGWRYALQHYAYDETVQRQYIATYDYVFNPVMNLKLKASYYQKNSTSGPRGIDRNGYIRMAIDPNNPGADYIDNVLYGNYGYSSVDNDNDGVYDDGYLANSFWSYRIQGVELSRPVPDYSGATGSGFKAPGSIYTDFVDDKTTTISGRADFEWQVNDIHLAKSGIEIINYNIEKDQLQSFLTVYADRFEAYLKGIYDIADYDTTSTTVPSELYSVVSDGEGTYIPIYKPVDYYNAALASSGKRDGYQANPWQAAYYLQDKMEWEGMIVNAGLRFDFWYLGSSYKVALDNGTDKTVSFNKSDRTQMMVSPRLGVSHPITDRDVLRFAYNYQNQLPQMQYIFTSKTPEDANVSDQTITVGNPTLQPQITVTYEVGLSHQISEDYVLDMTAYYKNLYNYVSTQKVKKPGEEQISWYEYISEDYGSTRGIDMQLEKLLSDFNSWSVAYSLAWAQGNNSDTVTQDENTNLREFPLDWDVRHNLSFNYTFRISKGEEYFVPFTDYILPLDDFSANMTWSLASGSPYTPQSEVGDSDLDTNSKRKDFTQQANMRISKGIDLPSKMKLKIFVDVENLFKTKNILYVYPKTGLWNENGADIIESDTGFIYDERRYLTKMASSDPNNYNNFRSVTLGLSVNF